MTAPTLSAKIVSCGTPDCDWGAPFASVNLIWPLLIVSFGPTFW